MNDPVRGGLSSTWRASSEDVPRWLRASMAQGCDRGSPSCRSSQLSPVIQGVGWHSVQRDRMRIMRNVFLLKGLFVRRPSGAPPSGGRRITRLPIHDEEETVSGTVVLYSPHLQQLVSVFRSSKTTKSRSDVHKRVLTPFPVSRRSVLIRSPGFLGISEGAMT